MERWNELTRKREESPIIVENFLKELFMLYDKYNLSIVHEDQHGSFIIETNSEINKEWMKECSFNIDGQTTI